MIFAALFLIASLTMVQGGTLCPPRKDLYPCTCISVSLSKNNFHTIVSCHRLPNSDALVTIFPTLMQMHIDQFYLYDSFWEAHMLGAIHMKKLPADWFTLLKIKEFEVVDTPLSTGFACDAQLTCKNTVMNRFTTLNSSISDTFAMCNSTRGNKFSWFGCLEKLKHFHLMHGDMRVVRREFFLDPMRELVTLNLTNNKIRKIEDGAFANFNRLTSLDLSHNNLEALTNVFRGANKLEFLDLSWNMLVEFGPHFIQSLPVLKTLSVSNNRIQLLKKSEWDNVPKSLRNIDLRDNPFRCDCGIIWINGTFHVNVVIQGTCATPQEYKNSRLRRASRLLSERCDRAGNIGTRPPKRLNPSRPI